MMKLYQEHGVNPLEASIGCAPLVVRLPVLTAPVLRIQGGTQRDQRRISLFNSSRT